MTAAGSVWSCHFNLSFFILTFYASCNFFHSLFFIISVIDNGDRSLVLTVKLLLFVYLFIFLVCECVQMGGGRAGGVEGDGGGE